MLDHRHLLILYLLTSTRPSVLPICKTLGNPQFEHPMNQHDLRIPESDSWPSAFPLISFWAHQRSGPQLRSYLAGLCRIISGQASEARPNFERVQQYSKMRKRRLGGKTGQMFENPGCGPVEEHYFFGISIISRLPLLILPSKNLQKDTQKKMVSGGVHPSRSLTPVDYLERIPSDHSSLARKLAARGWFGFPEGWSWTDTLLQ